MLAREAPVVRSITHREIHLGRQKVRIALETFQRSADDLLGRPVHVHVGRVEEVDADLVRPVYAGRRLLFCDATAVGQPATQGDLTYLDPTTTQSPVLHHNLHLIVNETLMVHAARCCNRPCLLICCRLRAPLLQERPILLQCSHRYSIHEEGAGAKVRATLQPGLTNRLTKYLRTTQQLIEEGRDAVSSKELGDFTGINPVQVRRDLNAIGFSGTRGVGYQAYDLVEAVRNILGLRQTYNIALVGAG